MLIIDFILANLRGYTQSCTFTSDCMTTKGLVCAAANSCNCPSSGTGTHCDCPSTGYYYDFTAAACGNFFLLQNKII